MSKHDESLPRIIWRTPLLRRILAVVLMGAIALPAYDFILVYPAFSRLLVKAVEEDARRTAKHFSHILGVEANEFRCPVPRKRCAEGGGNAAPGDQGFRPLESAGFLPDGEIVFSTADGEIGERNDKPYFHQKVAKGEIFSKTGRKDGRTMEGETAPLDVIEIYVPVMSGERFVGAFEIYYDVSRETQLLQSLLLRSGFILVVLAGGFVLTATLLVIATARESRRLARTRNALDTQEELFRDVIEVAQDAVIVTDAAQKIKIVNPAFTKLTGFEREEVLGKTPAFLKSGRQDAEFYIQMKRSLEEHKRWRGEIWDRRKDGNVFPGLLSISTIEGKEEGDESYVAIYTDLSEQKAAEEVYQNLAYHDPLTGLPNRTLFLDRLGKAVQAHGDPDEQVALFFLDLDRFKQTNDEMGHEAGDLVLQEVARRLTNSVRQGDTVSRLGGDEFTLIVPRVDERKTIERIANDLVERITGPIHLSNGDTTGIGVSIGISRFPLDSRNIEDLIAKADSAMYEAKQAGGNRFVFYNAPAGEASGPGIGQQ